MDDIYTNLNNNISNNNTNNNMINSSSYTEINLEVSTNQNQTEEGETEENEIPPDSKYYENNVLKMKKIYTAQKGAYYTWVYFDENLAVKTYYEDDIRVRDEFYNNGKLFRTKTYEKPQTQEEQTDGQTVVQGEKR